MKLRGILGGVFALAISTSVVFAQTGQGSSPLTPAKGGTNSAFVGFTGPASSVKTFTLPNASDTIATLAAIQTFTAAKTFASAKLLLAGSSSGAGTLNAPAAASTYVWTLPAATDTLVGRDTTDTLTNKTLTSPIMTAPTLGVATATSINKVAITAPATAATLTIPDGVTLTGPAASGTAMTLGNTETVTGIKTFGSAGAVGRLKIAGTTSGSTVLDATAAASGTLTLPAATDTLVGKATTDTLTNKTLTAPVMTTPTLGAATATSINGNFFTAGTYTLTGAASKTFTFSNTLTVAGTDGTTLTFQGTDTYVGRATTDTLTNKTFNTQGTGNAFTLNGVAFGTATQATAALNAMVGDSGSGGTKGLVPAPGAGDAAAGKFLKADGTFAVPPGSGGGSLPDDVRQNVLLNTIYQSKNNADIRRTVLAFATGLKSTTDTLRGINAGSSSNYDVTNSSASGYVLPSTTGGSTTRITGATPTVPLGGTAANINDNTPATTSTTSPGNLSAAGVTARIVAKLDLGSNFTVTQIDAKQLTGGSTTESFYTSTDDITYTIFSTTFNVTTTPTDYTKTASVTARYVALVAEQTNWGATSIVLGDLNAYYVPAPTTNNMTLVTTSQTADSTVSNGRVLIEYDNTATPTLNTDLTIEVTCDNGSHWTSASLSAVTSNSQGGRKVAETVDQAATGGTSFAARLKTLNNKSVPIYGLSLTVH